MIKRFGFILIIGIVCTPLFTFANNDTLGSRKIGGVNLVSPRTNISNDYVQSIKRISANWIAILPYAFMENNEPEIEYNCPKNWWGDTPKGIQQTVTYARQHNLNILLKPHFWVDGKGWAGELEMTDSNWTNWEQEYTSFIVNMASKAEEYKIEMLCIGTELKSAVQLRPEFWNVLIPKIRSVYSGKLIYAANWDNYENVPFWSQLDYIGVDAYFPLSSKNTPLKSDLLRAWQKAKHDLKRMSDSTQKQVIFTEMGYRSIDKAAWKQWEIENTEPTEMVNLTAQENGYSAIFESFWTEKWFAGGFIWKWKSPDYEVGGTQRSDYTPQNKPVEKVIKKWYEKVCMPQS